MNPSKFVMMLIAASMAGQVSAAEWSPISMEGHRVREVDPASVARNGPVVMFSTRHTFADPNEYRVSRREAKYLLIHNRANCVSRTLAQLATEAYDEKMVLISKHQVTLQQDLPVIKGGIDDAVLDFVCGTGN